MCIPHEFKCACSNYVCNISELDSTASWNCHNFENFEVLGLNKFFMLTYFVSHRKRHLCWWTRWGMICGTWYSLQISTIFSAVSWIQALWSKNPQLHLKMSLSNLFFLTPFIGCSTWMSGKKVRIICSYSVNVFHLHVYSVLQLLMLRTFVVQHISLNKCPFWINTCLVLLPVVFFWNANNKCRASNRCRVWVWHTKNTLMDVCQAW